MFDVNHLSNWSGKFDVGIWLKNIFPVLLFRWRAVDWVWSRNSGAIWWNKPLWFSALLCVRPHEIMKIWKHVCLFFVDNMDQIILKNVEGGGRKFTHLAYSPRGGGNKSLEVIELTRCVSLSLLRWFLGVCSVILGLTVSSNTACGCSNYSHSVGISPIKYDHNSNQKKVQGPFTWVFPTVMRTDCTFHVGKLVWSEKCSGPGERSWIKFEESGFKMGRNTLQLVFLFVRDPGSFMKWTIFLEKRRSFTFQTGLWRDILFNQFSTQQWNVSPHWLRSIWKCVHILKTGDAFGWDICRSWESCHWWW